MKTVLLRMNEAKRSKIHEVCGIPAQYNETYTLIQCQVNVLSLSVSHDKFSLDTLGYYRVQTVRPEKRESISYKWFHFLISAANKMH